jgi:hypothetical protein
MVIDAALVKLGIVEPVRISLAVPRFCKFELVRRKLEGHAGPSWQQHAACGASCRR